MDASDFPAPKALPEHDIILKMAGKWAIKTQMWMDPTAPPMEGTAEEAIELVGFHSVSDYQSDFMGQPFRGRCTLSYDPVRAEYVSTWIDNMGPAMFRFTGKVNPENGKLEMGGKQSECFTNREANFRTVTTPIDDDHHVFEMFMEAPGGQEMQTMRMEYTRVP